MQGTATAAPDAQTRWPTTLPSQEKKMTEPNHAKSITPSRFSRVIFGSMAFVSLLEALQSFSQREVLHTAMRFAGALMWGLLALLKTESRHWSIWLLLGSFVAYVALIIVEFVAQ